MQIKNITEECERLLKEQLSLFDLKICTIHLMSDAQSLLYMKQYIHTYT